MKTQIKPTLKNKLLKIALIVFVSFGLSVFIYAQIQEQETSTQTLNRIANFYLSGTHTNGYDYQKDKETLQWIKQEKLDNLSFEQTLLYNEQGKTDDKIITKIDETIVKIDSLKNELPKPAYLNYGKDIKRNADITGAFTEPNTPEAQRAIHFINLLK